nr:Phage-related minor tail protein [uncultured Mediterranean phage uvMED]
MAKRQIKFELTAVDRTKAKFDSVTKGLNKIGSASASAAKGVAGVGLAATATAGALALVVNKSFEFIDAIGKTATRTGITTSAIQAFHLAARESGTNIEGANKALEKFARSVGDSQRGLKTMTDIFKALGVELETSDGHFKSTDTLLEEVAIGISNLGSQTQKATALANLFGRQGILLTNALEDLSDRGMDGFIDRAERLGLILSTKTIRRVESFNDAVGVIKMQIGSFVNNVSASFLPIFEKIQVTIAEKIQKIIDDFGGMDGIAVFVQNSIITFAQKAIIAIGDFRDQFASFVREVQIKARQIQIELRGIAIAILEALPKDFSDEIEGLRFPIQGLEGDIRFLQRATTEHGIEARKTAEGLEVYKITLEDLRDGQDIFTQGLNDANNELNRIMPINAFIDKLNDFDATLETIAVNSMKKFEDSIIEGLRNGKLAFKDFADFVVEQLLRVAIQQLIVRQIIDPFSDFLSGFDFLDKTPKKPSKGGGKGSIFEGGGYTGMGARTGGVDGRGGFPAILHPNETVIDHTKGQGMGATVNFNISTVDAAGFDELLATRKNMIISMVNQAYNSRGKMGIA